MRQERPRRPRESKRQFPQLPSREEMAPIALRWAADQQSYLARDMKQHLVEHYRLTPDLLKLKFAKKNGTAFDNYADWVNAILTTIELQVGLDDEQFHKDPSKPYRLTALGRRLAPQPYGDVQEQITERLYDLISARRTPLPR
jgi:hypothetical protein